MVKSLYFPTYTKYLGKPLYRVARRAGLSRISGIAAAHAPAALFHGALAGGTAALMTRNMYIIAAASVYGTALSLVAAVPILNWLYKTRKKVLREEHMRGTSLDDRM